MTGTKGKSGGPRANSGGARAGAGRKPKSAAAKSAKASVATAGGVEVSLEAQAHGGALKRKKAEPVTIPETDMLTLLKDVALGRVDATALQVRAAIAAVQYTHTKKGDGGKKDEKEEAAKRAGKGKFAAAAPPKLVVNNGR